MIQDYTYWQNRSLLDEQRDWPYERLNWIDDYKASIEHPHRKVIVDELKQIEWENLLEIGCNCGPNLYLIDKEFPKALLYGVDPSVDAITQAKQWMPQVAWEIGTAQKLYFSNKSMDCILIDAALMYVPPDEINQVMDEIDRVAKKLVIIVERFSETDENNGHIWSRNYTKLLQDRGFEVKEINMTEELWPTSKNWQLHGRYFVCHRVSQTSTPS